MRISQKLEYACRAMGQLAKHYDGITIIRLEDIAQREAVSANFLVQILNDLRKADLIISKRGKLGGYLLASEPESITLSSIVEAIEPTLLTKEISEKGESGQFVALAWLQVSSTLNQHLSTITLKDLMPPPESHMFYI